MQAFDEKARVRLASGHERILHSQVDFQRSHSKPAATTRSQRRQLLEFSHPQEVAPKGPAPSFAPARDRQLHVVDLDLLPSEKSGGFPSRLGCLVGGFHRPRRKPGLYRVQADPLCPEAPLPVPPHSS